VTPEGYLLLRRLGGLFGVASAKVLALSRRGAFYRVEIAPIAHVADTPAGAGGVLLADEVVGVVADLDVRPLAPLVRRFWPEPAAGWAIHAGDPVVVVDPCRPPRALAEGDVPDGE
jgi:hypothetical protein